MIALRILTYIVLPEDEGRAVRSVAPRRFRLGAHAFRRLKVQGGIRVNGEIVRADRILHTGETLCIHLPDALSATDDAPAQALKDALYGLPESHIRYMDEDLIILSKGAPLPTLPSRHIATATLREQLCQMLGANPAAFAYHPVNRLDKGTSGLLCVARHAHAQRLLSAHLHTGGFIREYLAVTQGVPSIPEGIIDAPIARLGPGVARAVRENGQRAVTHYSVEQTAHGRALLRLRLETGRTHQIRVHLSHISCPIVGDYLYGAEHALLPGRFALHSAYLSLTQPITGERIEISEPPPPCFDALLASDVHNE